MNSKLARLIYPEYRFGKTDPAEGLRLVKMGVGGFCIYGGSPEEIRKTTSALQSASGTPLIFSADYENGAGQWMKDATQLPSNMAVGASGSEEIARRKAQITAREAAALGVSWILAPVTDLATRAENPIVNTRAFGEDPGLVSRMAGAYISGLRSENSISCIKHFPGHGETSLDSHLELPIVDRSRSQLEESELRPYRNLLSRSDTVMIGHLKVPDLDPEIPASFSRKIITGLLREELGFEGCVVTDALSMKAVENERFAGVAALLAGADILLVPDDPYKLLDSLKNAYGGSRITDGVITAALKRQDILVRKTGPALINRPGLDIVGCREHRDFITNCAPECLAWVRRPSAAILKRGDSVEYMEPGVSDPILWNGKAFVAALKKLGIRTNRVSGQKTSMLIAASFSRPRAYSGSINLSPENREEIALKSAKAASVTMISFGSPFVFEGMNCRPAAKLCAFCALDEFQAAAAQVLAGTAEARGMMPVTIKEK
ncbi:MAG: glycoside hydrolase family 3 N-terminal domain-containing protein [bacterium]